MLTVSESGKAEQFESSRSLDFDVLKEVECVCVQIH